MILGSGAFDGLHAGHVGYLREAHALRQRNERVVIGVAPDEYVHRVKGRMPVWSQGARLNAVRAYADEVFLHHQDGIASDIRFFTPRLLVKGLDWRGHLPSDIILACADMHTAMAFVDSGSPIHTSDHARV